MKEYKSIERRRYIRLKSVFPVQFRLLGLDGREGLSDFLQGFTADVSKGGILLRVNNLRPELCDMLEKRMAKLLLYIDIPLSGRPIEATANVAWMKTFKEGIRDLCMIGVSFDNISKKDRNRLVGYTASLYRMPKLATFALLLMLIALGINRIDEINLRKENTLLIERLVDALQKRGSVTEWLDEADREKGALLIKLEEQKDDIAKIKQEMEGLLIKEEELKASVKDLDLLKQELDKSRNMRTLLESQLARLTQDKKDLQRELDRIAHSEETRFEELFKIEKARQRLEIKAVDNMYNWLKVHQNRRTGLVASFEGDPSLKEIAFTYDQSLAAQAFLLYDDIEEARAIFDFFDYKAKRQKGGFANAYDINRGSIVEHTVHSGPNIWLGIALMQYLDKKGGEEYLDLAKSIADWTIKIQDEDPDGGIRGGPDVTWFSTEHNLDAYAFFTMLAQKRDSEKYRGAAEKSLNWIRKNAFSADEGRIYRGKGDSTIATDTFSWAIAAIGPERLIEIGMDPDAIMEFAEDNCKATVDFVRPDGRKLKVTGFDFAKHRHLARGGVVSSEWTAQMIVSLRMMGDFYLEIGDIDKVKFYQDKSNFYISELEKLIIASPSRTGQGAGCLPYATQDDVDTGHGWRTPRGRDTGSVSGTAYGIFAIKGYNPLQL